jgi:hypothetical protein
MGASDLNVYRSCYCESCHQLKRDFGIASTAAVNYDMTFNSIVLNSLSENGIKDQNMKSGMICILRKCTADTDILRRIAGYTLLLTKWELEDDRRDRPNIRSNAASVVLGRAIRKAERLYPEYDEHVRRGFDSLMRMERDGMTDAAAVGSEFSEYLMPAMRDIAGDAWNDDLRRLFIGLGTMVYVMDAVDDLEEDYMNETFNPFLSGCESFVNKELFIRKNIYGITDSMNSLMTDIQAAYSSVRSRMRFHHGVSDNIIYRGIPDSAKRAISGDRSARPTFMNALSSRILRRSE